MFKTNSGSSSVMIDRRDNSLRAKFAVRANDKAETFKLGVAYALAGLACALPFVVALAVLS